MNRADRRLALSSVSAAFALALAVPTAAVARDSFGSDENGGLSYPTRHDGYDRERYDRREGAQDDRYGKDASSRSESNRGSGPRADRHGDPSAEPHGGGHSSAGDAGGDSAEDQDDPLRAGQRVDDQDVPREVQRARARAAERIRRAGIAMAFLQQQQMMVIHLERADAFLAAMAQRIERSDLDPGPRQTLLGLIDERRATVAGLVERVQSAETHQDLEEIRPATYDPVGASHG